MTFSLSNEDIKRCREIALGNRDRILDVLRAVSEQTGIPVTAILSARRERAISQARGLVCYIAHVEQGHSQVAVGRALRIDHTSVCHAVKMERKRRGEA